LATEERHRSVDFHPKYFQYPANSYLARGGKTIQIRSTDEARCCPKSQRLDDIRSAPDAAVKEYGYSPPDSRDYLRKHFNRPLHPIELAAAVV
jgi:hypothetical protein